MGEGDVWTLGSSIYKVYSLIDSQISMFKVIITLSTSMYIVQISHLASVKVEQDASDVDIISNSDDDVVLKINLGIH